MKTLLEYLKYFAIGAITVGAVCLALAIMGFLMYMTMPYSSYAIFTLIIVATITFLGKEIWGDYY